MFISYFWNMDAVSWKGGLYLHRKLRVISSDLKIGYSGCSYGPIESKVSLKVKRALEEVVSVMYDKKD